jgi:hypothetical protein
VGHGGAQRHCHALVLSLRGDMGLWSLRGRWDYMRLQFYFRLALQHADSWLAKVATLGRQMPVPVPVRSGAHKRTWHHATERLMVKYGVERGAMGAYRITPAFLKSVGVTNILQAKSLARALTEVRAGCMAHAGSCRSKPPLAWHESTIGWDMTCRLPPSCLHPTGGGPLAPWGAHVPG